MPLIRSVQGSLLEYSFTLTEDDGVTQHDLTGEKVIFTIKADPGDPDSAAVVQAGNTAPMTGITVPAPATGAGTVKVPGTQLVNVIPGRRYVWDLKVIDPDGDDWTPLRGTAIFDAAVTAAST